MNCLQSLATFKMDSVTAQAFAEAAGLAADQLHRFGHRFCFVPLVSDHLVALIKDEDYSVREATAAFFKELLSSG